MINPFKKLTKREKEGLILFSLIVICFTGFSFWFFIGSRTTVYGSNWSLLTFISLNAITVIGGVSLLQYWSIVTVNKAAIDWKEKKCKYCNNETSKLVCPSCDSIQWNSSSDENLLTSVAIFLAHHRWKVINGILTFVLIGPLLFAVKFHFEEVSKIQIKNERINIEVQSIIQYSNQIRPKLHSLNQMLREGTLDSLTKLTLIGEREALTKQYFDFAWKLAEVIDYLKHTEPRRNEHSAYSKAMVLINQEGLIPNIDAAFYSFEKRFSLFINKKEKDLLEKNIVYFNDFLKGISCAIGEISINPNTLHEEKSIIEGCDENISEINKLFNNATQKNAEVLQNDLTKILQKIK